MSSTKKMFLKILQNLQENTCARVSFLIKLQASDLQLYYEAPTQVFSCEFGDIFKNIFFVEHIRTTASAVYHKFHFLSISVFL